MFPILLTGFSQGAHVVQSVLDQLDDEAATNSAFSSIRGVGLLASPRFSPDDPAARGTFIAEGGREGIAQGAEIRDRFVFGSFPVARTYCLDNDSVCQATTRNLIGTISKLNKTHTNGYNFGAGEGEPILNDMAALFSVAVRREQSPPIPVGSLVAYRENIRNDVRVSAASIYSNGSPSVSFAWVTSDGTIDESGSIPWVKHRHRLGALLGRFGTKKVITTVEITFNDGTVQTRSLCVRLAPKGPATC